MLNKKNISGGFLCYRRFAMRLTVKKVILVERQIISAPLYFPTLMEFFFTTWLLPPSFIAFSVTV
jgi:hypothetical protein